MLLTAPTVFWLVVFFVVPTLAMVVISFRPTTPYGGSVRVGRLMHGRHWRTRITR